MVIRLWQLVSIALSLAMALLASPANAQNAPSCNSVAFSQIPNNIDYFVGRRFPDGGCPGSNFTLNVWQMDWSTNQLHLVNDVISLPVSVDGNTISGAYDPSVFVYNNETWVAFECVGSGPALSNTNAASCMAPLVGVQYLDTSRLSIVVRGRRLTSNQDGYSASVPKVFVFNGLPYIYWTASHFINAADGAIATDTTVRGALLSEELGGAHRFWLSGSGNTTSDTLGSNTSEVMSHNSSDITLNGIADGFDVLVYNGRLLMSAGVGGAGCSNPLSPMYACYRLQIRAASAPLATDAYDASAVTSLALPINPHEYSRFFVKHDGSYNLLAQFFNPTLNGSSAPGPVTSVSFTQFAIDPGAFQFGSPSQGLQPKPNYPGAYLSSNFSTFQQFMPSCEQNNPYPNLGNNDCRAAASRYCVSQGYDAGGLLAENYQGLNNVGCLTSAHALRMEINASSLTSYNGSCNYTNLSSGSCASAIAAYCRGIGYSGGFGPLEVSGTRLQVACPDYQIGGSVSTTFSALSAQQSDCSGSWPTSMKCAAAASRICRLQGYVASYGVTDYYYDDAVIGCWRAST